MIHLTLPAFQRTALAKLEQLEAQGFRINGVAIRKETEDGYKQGLVTDYGQVCWFNPNGQPNVGSKEVPTLNKEQP